MFYKSKGKQYPCRVVIEYNFNSRVTLAAIIIIIMADLIKFSPIIRKMEMSLVFVFFYST